MPGGQGPSSKGNPATTRMLNPNLKARRARSWARGQVRKAARRKAQEARERANKARREAGELTPWEKAKQVRANNRKAVHNE